MPTSIYVVITMLAVMFGVPSAAIAHDHTPFDLDGDGHEDLLYQNVKNGIIRLTTVSADGLRGTSSDSLGGDPNSGMLAEGHTHLP